VHDVAIVAYPDRRNGVGLYAFVAAADELNERTLRDFLDPNGPPAPEHIQLTEALPRDRAGNVRIELLQLVALNQIDLIPRLIAGDPEQATITKIIANRRNLLDRIPGQ
jgi:acyl-coenzyme A synthetase/AMP-(fatty) acid ligase